MTTQRLVIIVTLSLLAAIVLLSATCFVFREDLARVTTKSALRTFYTTVVADTSVQVDTASLGMILRGFSDKVDSVKLDNPDFMKFMETMYQVYQDRKVTTEDVDRSVAAIGALYPELTAQWKPGTMKPEGESETDSIQPSDAVLDTSAVVESTH
jgi:hypothetical protein